MDLAMGRGLEPGANGIIVWQQGRPENHDTKVSIILLIGRSVLGWLV